MPKIIKDPKEKILKVSSKELEAKGYEKLSMREIAKKSGIGLGTIYNYFDDKLSIVAALVSIDWNKELNELSIKLENISNIEEGIRLIYVTIRQFWSTHKELLLSIQVKNLKDKYQNGHKIFVNRLSILIKNIYSKFNEFITDTDLVLLSNIIISSSIQEEINIDDLINFLKHFVLKGGNNNE